MKKMWGTRVLAMLLVLALTAGLVPAALAAKQRSIGRIQAGAE